MQGGRLGVQSVHATPACHINPPRIVLSQGKYVLARKPLIQPVALDAWFVHRGMVDPPDTTLAGSDPQSSLTIRKQRVDRAAGNLMGDKLTAGIAPSHAELFRYHQSSSFALNKCGDGLGTSPLQKTLRSRG